MKTFFESLKTTGTILAAGLMLFSACKKDPVKPPVEEKCANHGKFTRAICTASIFNDYVILPDGGNEYLVPCKTSAGIPSGISDGTLVNFSYEVLPGSEGCNDRMFCEALPDKPLKYVRITCWETPEVQTLN